MKLAITFVLCLCAATSSRAETISVAAAISLKDALSKVARAYKADAGDDIEFTFGSSGQLAQQISGGAPIDLFISAADKQVDDLAKSRAILPDSRKVIAGNALVVIVPTTAATVPTETRSLSDPAIFKIAMGEPRSVPAGQYAEQAMRSAKVYESIKERLVLGTNVRQVLDYVERGEVQAGIVYATDARLSGDKVRVAFKVGESEHSPIVYPAAIVAASRKREAAEKFLNYLLAPGAQAEMAAFGFASPPAGPSTRSDR